MTDERRADEAGAARDQQGARRACGARGAHRPRTRLA
jgi:hypothetical protein